MVCLFVLWFSLAFAGLVPPGALLWIVPLLGLPAGVGVAILRHRLYDIDRIINRTLVFGAITAVLALVYAGSVVALQRIFTGFAEEDSELAVVASTLAIAALFGPLRRRVQAPIDRAFYRKKYDAERILESFSARLRDETDLVSLGDTLAGTIEGSMPSAHVSLWLREQEKTPRGTRDGGGAGPRTGEGGP